MTPSQSVELEAAVERLLHLTVAEDIMAALHEDMPALDCYDEDEMAAFETTVALVVKRHLEAALSASNARALAAEEAFQYVSGLLPSAAGAMDREADTCVLTCMVNVGELRKVREFRTTLASMKEKDRA